ncbi:uncharacterized protein [Henckelia pumila]|uniref:uncharacterized protein n=1 Tax=Henckelia pumila TaxID=405737 RepID=UPI003C6E0B48
MGIPGSFGDWWNNLVLHCSGENLDVAAVVLWNIWLNRNEVVWNAKHKSPALILQTAMDLHAQWMLVHQRHSLSIRLQVPLAENNWLKPPSHSHKCNVDAALFENPPRMGFGCIVRDHLGLVSASIHGVLPGSFSPSTAEALGIREALSWIKDFEFSSVIVESNALVVINALIHSSGDASSLGLILEDCRVLALDLQSCVFSFARRSTNHAAHALAKAAGSMSGCEGRITPSSLLISDVISVDY